MKIKFLKDHLDNKKDDVRNVNDWRANYWIKTGVAKVAPKAVKKAETKERKVKLEKK